MCSNQLNLANLSGGCASKDNHHQHSSSDDESDTDDEAVTRDLNSWRIAVGNATSAAQLSIYVSQLVRCIAWEKSIMKVVSCFYKLLHLLIGLLLSLEREGHAHYYHQVAYLSIISAWNIVHLL